ncbi:MAG: glycosyltransferase family 4 protein [Pseudomonadota bacterium]
MSSNPEFLYLSHSRLHRNRANLLQTLHTLAALTVQGIKTAIYLPPWHSGTEPVARLAAFGIDVPLDLRSSPWLHRRWPPDFFALWHRRRLLNTPAVYVRAPRISLALARLGIAHHLEIHTLRALQMSGQLAPLIAHHRAGQIRTLLPISATAAQALIAAGAVPERIHVSPSGVDVARFGAVPALDPARLARPRLLYVGSVSADRGLPLFAALASDDSLTITLVGSAPPGPLAERLHYRPPVPHREVPALYQEADLVLLPYQPELEHADAISPLKLFEAMAAGRPIVASDIPPLREILRDRENALLVPPRDVNAWRIAIKTLRTDPALAIRLAETARREAQAYDWRTRAARIARAIGLR